MRFPDLQDKKFAEFVGIMLGDGSIGRYKCKYKNGIKIQYQVKVTLDSRNKEYINHVKDLMNYLFGFEPKVNYKKNENTADIRIFRKEIFNFLVDKAELRKSPKWMRAIVPSYLNDDNKIHLLRGIFDTDGSVVITKNNGTLYPRLELKMSPAPMQSQIINIVKQLGFKFKVQKLDRGKIRIRINGKKELQKWMGLIGTNNYLYYQKAKKFYSEGRI